MGKIRNLFGIALGLALLTACNNGVGGSTKSGENGSQSSIAAAAGQSAKVELVGVEGSPPFTYQWRKDGEIIPGATNSTLHLMWLEVSDAGAYDLVVSNIAGSTASNIALLTIIDPVTGQKIRPRQSSVYPSKNPGPRMVFKIEDSPLR